MSKKEFSCLCRKKLRIPIGMHTVLGIDEERGARRMQSQIRLSALFLAAVMSIGVVAGMIVLRPPLTQMYYVQLGGLIAVAGLIVTLYNRFLTARARRRAELPPQEDVTEIPRAEPLTDALRAADSIPAAALPAYTATMETGLPDAAVAYPAVAVLTDDVPPSAAETLSMPESLDALLDIAYEAADSNPARAIAAYRRALARYPEDSYMPYLIIELCTLYKNLGDYDAALALFDEALALPVIAKNAVMLQEFQHSRNILTVVSHMLTAQGTPALPFGEVPKELLMEADRRAEELGKH